MFAEKFKRLEAQGNALHLEDYYGHLKYWDELTDLLCENENATIQFLESCTIEEALTVSEVFDEVSTRLQSQRFIDCLRMLDKKYPEANLTDFIDSARSCIEKEESKNEI